MKSEEVNKGPEEAPIARVELTQITPDLARLESTEGGYTFHEEINFRNDSGYELHAMIGRARAVVDRAFRSTGSIDPTIGITHDKLPPFRSSNKLVVIVKVVEG